MEAIKMLYWELNEYATLAATCKRVLYVDAQSPNMLAHCNPSVFNSKLCTNFEIKLLQYLYFWTVMRK